ncbi:choline transmembrane transporter [Schizosaccharomyces octosporus yFS286]|uniref:Choline transmembrane transporter n=1 Tax=Schizosaccharomyces octosporus (strain yFS286) TaxID=483514 RepID=S9RCL2_SCHOY|nr:choline transmembrane transporter [Schizosaccharomyces octosporus yFS286]EPX71854.1 choline transmembrane transporter [Schizosaccharomyces octosporus yFS286]
MFSDYASRFLAQSRFSSAGQQQSGFRPSNSQLDVTGTSLPRSIDNEHDFLRTNEASSAGTSGLNSLLNSESLNWQLREEEQSEGSEILTNSDSKDKRFMYMSNGVVESSVQPESELNSSPSGNDEFMELPNERYMKIERKVPDKKWGILFGSLCLVMFTYSILTIWRTNPDSPPETSAYATIQKAFPLFQKDAIICAFLAIAWLIFLVAVPQFLVFLLAVAPISMFFFSIYLLNASKIHLENSTQSNIMRVTGVSLLLFTLICSTYIWRHWSRFATSFNIVKLACRVISDIPQIVLVFISFLVSFYILIFVWVRLFARLFLRGSSFVGSVWVSPKSSWILASFYAFHFLWLCVFLNSLQCAILSSIVSQWFFYRNTRMTATKTNLVAHFFSDVLYNHYGLCSLSSLLRVTTKVPLHFLPRWLRHTSHLVYYMFTSVSASYVASPLALAYASIYSIPYMNASKALSQIEQLNRVNLRRRCYYLSKYTLLVARSVLAVGVGVTAWNFSIHSNGIFYGYLVGILGGFLAWLIIGVIEGGLSMLVDALLICSIIDISSCQGDPNGSHCYEAWQLFESNGF